MHDDDVMKFGEYKGWIVRDVYLYGDPEYIQRISYNKTKNSDIDSFARYCRRQRNTKKKRLNSNKRSVFKSNKLWIDPNFDSDIEDLDNDAVCPKCYRIGPSQRDIYLHGACESCLNHLLPETSGYKLGCPSCHKIRSKRHESSLRANNMCITCATDEYMIGYT